MDKILTIIIPTYNMEKYLDKCLTSLIISDENMTLLEVLVINDGSKDNSSSIAHKYEKYYPNTFRVIDKENGNYGSCINRGLKEITGKYVKVLDADDYFDTQVFDEFISFLKKQNVDLVINDFSIVDEEAKRLEEYNFNLPASKSFTLSDFPKGIHEWIWHHAMTYSSSIFDKIQYHQTENISYTDDEWVLLPMSMVKKVCYFPHDMYQYLRGREGQTFDPKILLRSFDMRIKVAKAMVKGYEELYERSSEEARKFMEHKLVQRLKPLYYFYLVKHNTPEGNRQIKEFDLYVKERSTRIFSLCTCTSVNFVNWKFIRNWRNSSYKAHTVMLAALILLEKFHKYTYNMSVSRMPKQLKRQK